jgi:peptidoglycan/xylan/chitin deacetylase (PgdA/CDA1 family)
MALKKTLGAALTSAAFRWLFRRWTRHTVPVVMLHRFSEQPGPDRTTVASLDRALAAVRREGLTPRSLGDLAAELGRGRVPGRSICFTVDDGYRDFKDLGQPVFARYDAPVTVFLTSGFIDGAQWNWWDWVRAAFEATETDLAGMRDALGRPFPPAQGLRGAVVQMVESCKEVPDGRRREALETLRSALGVALPDRPVDAYAAMNWEDVRKLSAQGVEFGGHTVTHPILSRVDAATLERELVESFAAVERVTGRLTRVFAYPNGRAQDFDAAAIDALKRLDVAAAVTTEPGVVDTRVLRATDGRYRLPRVPLPQQPARQDALISGLETAKIALGWK